MCKYVQKYHSSNSFLENIFIHINILHMLKYNELMNFRWSNKYLQFFLSFDG